VALYRLGPIAVLLVFDRQAAIVGGNIFQARIDRLGVVFVGFLANVDQVTGAERTLVGPMSRRP
jgi:hypothetical protein